jgi:hypothetical protein
MGKTNIGADDLERWAELLEAAKKALEADRRENERLRLQLLHERECHEALKAWVRGLQS